MASRSQRFKKQHTRTPAYLNDPHLFYHLQSPVKIKQLVDSGMYELQGHVIVEKHTQNKLKLSDYTIDGVQKINMKMQKKLLEQSNNNMARSTKIQSTTGGKVVQRQMTISSCVSGNASGNVSGNNSRVQQTDRKQNVYQLPKIKSKNNSPPPRGLNQFKRKVL